jgi:hypothetical protein
MIFVEIRCDNCHAAIAESIEYTETTPYWGWRLWKRAVSMGWARRKTDHKPFCPNCVSSTESFSTVILPVESIPKLGYIQCESCTSRYETENISVQESFVRELRRNARTNGWKYIYLNESNTYQDYCPECEPDDVGKRRLELTKLVWSKPTVSVAEQLGVSDKAIEKRCKRLGVSKPPVGFWAKYHVGHIEDCISMIPESVIDMLGDEFVEEVYAFDRN